MKQERRKVLEMLADGCIDSQEAQLLLDTLYELQVEATVKEEAAESIWSFLLDLRNLKMRTKEYGRISQPDPTAYISWRPV